eukprot:Clim_evm82s156 gene=Clim_evmTU82s156
MKFHKSKSESTIETDASGNSHRNSKHKSHGASGPKMWTTKAVKALRSTWDKHTVGDVGNFNLVDTQSVKVLDTLDVDGVAQCIQSGRVNNIIVMSGAGISTAAGIPDFRSDNGLYARIAKEKGVERPEDAMDVRTFRKDPSLFFEVVNLSAMVEARPTLAHAFIRLLHDKGLLLRSYTQNVDNLERESGIPDEKIIEAHGSLHRAHCASCQAHHDMDHVHDALHNDEHPMCTECGDYVKPAITMFGEALPSHFSEHIAKDFPKCDMLFVMGTKLAVAPFNTLLDEVGEDVPRVLINREPVREASNVTQHHDPIMGSLGLNTRKAGFDFYSEHATRDVFLEGTVDDGVRKLCVSLGWAEDLEKTYTNIQNEFTNRKKDLLERIQQKRERDLAKRTVGAGESPVSDEMKEITTATSKVDLATDQVLAVSET